MTEQNNAPLFGLNAYNKKLHGATSKEEILLSLNKGIYGFLRAAKFSYEQDSLDKMCLYTQKAVRIILTLKAHFAYLDTENKGDVLQLYYDWLFKKTIIIHRDSNTPQEFDNLLSTIESFSLSFQEVARPVGSRQNFPIRADTLV